MAYWRCGYLYRIVRSGNRTVTEYLGHGEPAELYARLESIALEERLAAAADRREQARAERQAFEAARQQAARVDLIVSRGLSAAGFWRRLRHSWQRRTAMETEIQSPAVETATLELAEMAEFVFARAVSGKSAATHDKLVARLKALRAELAGPDPSPALRLAAEAAALAWADRWVIELAAAANPLGSSPALDRRRTWSQRRFSQALQTVEKVRRLARPHGPMVAIQVNRMTAPEPRLAIVQ